MGPAIGYGGRSPAAPLAPLESPAQGRADVPFGGGLDTVQRNPGASLRGSTYPSDPDRSCPTQSRGVEIQEFSMDANPFSRQPGFQIIRGRRLSPTPRPRRSNIPYHQRKPAPWLTAE